MHLFSAALFWRAWQDLAWVIHSGAYLARRAHRPGPLTRPPGRAEAPLWITHPCPRRVHSVPQTTHRFVRRAKKFRPTLTGALGKLGSE
jgi:hypothetical protein